MTLQLWLAGGNKKQEVGLEVISRTNELGGKWFQLVKEFLLQKTDGKEQQKIYQLSHLNSPSKHMDYQVTNILPTLREHGEESDWFPFLCTYSHDKFRLTKKLNVCKKG